ncbi:hypothetical protein ACQY1Q_02880 [Tenacibaculum sp. TC6]|uniref:hypothetical protein n=1 Tax=Tenacibaculum sp. TC6 TaxID=3423223 RepID=UPI003D364129
MIKILKTIVILLAMNTTVVSQEITKPLQYALNLEQLQKVFKEEAKGKEFLPIILVTGNRISPEVKVTMFGEKVSIIDNKETSNLIKSGHPYLELGKASYGEWSGRAEFIFFCGEIKTKIKLKRKDGKWELKNISQKNRKNYFWNF